MTATAPMLGEATITDLRAEIRGQVVTPQDLGYDAARAVWNGMHDRRPALVVRCSGVADVIAALGFARSNDLLIAVRGGGHSFAGFSTCDDGIVIDLGGMKGIRVDVRTRTATAQGGVLWGDIDHETQAFGLATPGGLVSTTGIAGFTLGGGIGWLVRKHGMTVDNLVAADVVTVDGQFVRASADENADLFWALRGGGGNFGIVTSFDYRLHAIGPMVAGGAVFLPGERARDVLRWYREWAPTLPDEVTTLVSLGSAFPVPFLPESLHGKPILAIGAMHCGSLEAGEEALRPLKELDGIVADLVGPIPYAAQQAMFDPLVGPGDQFYAKAGFVPALDDATIDVIVAAHVQRSSPISEIHIHQLGGAMAAAKGEATAVGERAAPWLVNLLGRCPTVAETPEIVAWARAAYDALAPLSTGSAYMNFLSAEGDERYRSAMGTKYERLRDLKRKWDPSNVLRLNQNIVP